MDGKLNIYEVIRGPWVTSKAYRLNQELQQLVLEVHPAANKPMVAETLKKLFNVEADKVHMIVLKGKSRRSGGRHTSQDKTRKKAIITLKEGYSLDMMDWSKVGGAASTSSVGKPEVSETERANS